MRAVTGTGTGRIVTLWRRAGDTPPPPLTPEGVVQVDLCTACGERRLTWPEDIEAGIDVWHHHFDYCTGGGDAS